MRNAAAALGMIGGILALIMGIVSFSYTEALYRWDEIPWDDLAFPSVRWALEQHREIGDAETFLVRGNPPGETGNYE